MQLTIRRGLIPLAALVFGCSGDNTGPGKIADGKFSFKVTGAFSQTITGNAIWVTGADADGGFAISLSSGQRGTIIGRESPVAPTVGTYQFANTNAETTPPEQFLVIAVLSSGFSLCGSESGSMQITSAGAHIRGTFTANVGCFDEGSNSVRDAVITGEFDAVEGQP